MDIVPWALAPGARRSDGERMIDLYPEFFRRMDERPDAHFYDRPRPSTHLDEPASRYVREVHDDLLPPSGHILDLMAGVRSHLRSDAWEVTGLGLNASELGRNPHIDHAVVHDLNRTESLPFGAATFDAAVCVASVQYMTRPTDTFAAVAECLRPGAPFVVSFSNRMFPSKAVLAWRASDDAAHVRLVRSYFARTPAFGDARVRRFVPPSGDPVYVVWAYRKA
jgi:SAM-dependent methyltransferase